MMTIDTRTGLTLIIKIYDSPFMLPIGKTGSVRSSAITSPVI